MGHDTTTGKLLAWTLGTARVKRHEIIQYFLRLKILCDELLEDQHKEKTDFGPFFYRFSDAWQIDD